MTPTSIDQAHTQTGHNPSALVWLVAPLSITLISTLPLWNGESWEQWASSAAVSALATGVIAWLVVQVRRANARTMQAEAGAQELASLSMQELTMLLQNVVPAWQHHVETVRQQTETAVIQLTDSFDKVIDQFDLAGIGGARASGSADASNTIGLLDLCERELQVQTGKVYAGRFAVRGFLVPFIDSPWHQGGAVA